MTHSHRRRAVMALCLLMIACSANRHAPIHAPIAPVAVAKPISEPPPPRPGEPSARRHDEIVVCGRMIHTGAPVVLWTDPGGYDAYRVQRRFSPSETRPVQPDTGCDTPNRYGARPLDRLSAEDAERVRTHGWTQEALARVVDKFVLHYDVCGTSRTCFRVLHDVRGLSVHFLLDVDGTIYQTLDLKERARHAGAANDHSVGVEIAQIGAYDPESAKDRALLATWYRADSEGRMFVHLPVHLGDPHLRLSGFVPRPARSEPVHGVIHGKPLIQYDFTQEQYRSLAHLSAALSVALPGIRLDAPRGADGAVRTNVLTKDELSAFGGLIGHWHVTEAKSDPGPAFDWDRVLRDATALITDNGGRP